MSNYNIDSISSRAKTGFVICFMIMLSLVFVSLILHVGVNKAEHSLLLKSFGNCEIKEIYKEFDGKQIDSFMGNIFINTNDGRYCKITKCKDMVITYNCVSIIN